MPMSFTMVVNLSLSNCRLLAFRGWQRSRSDLPHGGPLEPPYDLLQRQPSQQHDRRFLYSSWMDCRPFDVLPSTTDDSSTHRGRTADLLMCCLARQTIPLLIVDGLQTFDVLPGSKDDTSVHRGWTADLLMCCLTGAPNFLRSIDASATFSCRDT
ncbi:hypothetical protein TNCV_1462421 [Trichonephila clavipes]|nr:hypothetical protein TNCV_1462421 [Trichonephila clavipes]